MRGCGSVIRWFARRPTGRAASRTAASSIDALAEVTDRQLYPDRRAWHRAHAAAEPDEDVAADLERSAERAQSRGGVAAAAAFLERAAELTVDPARRGARALAAAHAKFEAAAFDSADTLLAAAEINPLDDLQRAQVARLRAEIVFARRRGSDDAPLLLDAAKHLEGLDDRLARETYLEALGAAIFAGRLGTHPTLREVAETARRAPAAPSPPTPDRLVVGRCGDEVHRRIQRIGSAVAHSAGGVPPSRSRRQRWQRPVVLAGMARSPATCGTTR